MHAELVLALRRFLEQVLRRHRTEHHAHPDRIHVLLPQSLHFAPHGPCEGGHGEHQRLAVGREPEALLVAFAVADRVEQLVRGRRVVAWLARAFGIETRHARRQDLHGGKRLAAVDHADEGIDVETERDRAAQRDLRLVETADDGIVHVEGHRSHRVQRIGLPADAAFRQRGIELAILEHAHRAIALEFDEVEAAALEFKQPRLIFLDDAEFDPSDLRQALAFHFAYHRGMRRVRAVRKGDGAVRGIGFQHDLRAALPFLEPVGPVPTTRVWMSPPAASTTSRATARVLASVTVISGKFGSVRRNWSV